MLQNHDFFWKLMLIWFIIVNFFKVSWINGTIIVLDLLDFYLFNSVLILPFFSNIYLSKGSFTSKINYSKPINHLLAFSFLWWNIFHFDKILKHFSFFQIFHLLNFSHRLIIFVPVFLIVANINEGTKYFGRKNYSKGLSILFYWVQEP